MTAPTAPAATAAKPTAAAVDVGPVGDRSKQWRRGVAYAFLIGYAVLMFVPFVWAIITSFKTHPDALRLTFIPNPFTTQGWEQAFDRSDARPRQAVHQQHDHLGIGHRHQCRARRDGRLRLRPAALSRPGAPVPARPGHADDPRPATSRADLQPPQLRSACSTARRSTAASSSCWRSARPSVFLLRQYFLTIPRDLEEAAKIDGAGFLTTFWRVMLPLAGPALAAVAILAFQGSWNAFFWPLVILRTDHWTPAVGLSQFRFPSSRCGRPDGGGDARHHPHPRSFTCSSRATSSRASRQPASRAEQPRPNPPTASPIRRL